MIGSGAISRTKTASQKQTRLRRLMVRTGRCVIDTTTSFLLALSMAAAIVRQGVRPLTWRRTVRHEFIHQCHRIGLKSLFFTVGVGVLVGMTFIYQLLSWLGVLGRSEQIGGLLVSVLCREMAPVVAGFIVLGRSGSSMVVELGNRKAGGQIHMLDAQGVDPFLLLVVPRVLAAALCTFCLTIIFIVAALGSGFFLENALEMAVLSAVEFLNLLLLALKPSDFAVISLKAISIGFSVALISCMAGLSERAGKGSVEELIPNAFALSLLTLLTISGLLTLLF